MYLDSCYIESTDSVGGLNFSLALGCFFKLMNTFWVFHFLMGFPSLSFCISLLSLLNPYKIRICSFLPFLRLSSFLKLTTI